MPPEVTPVEQQGNGAAIAALASEKARLLCAVFVFLVSLTLYGLTLAPTVTLVDSGELIVAVRFLGVAHPPGFPLYALLAHLATLVPFGNVAVRVNFASAVFAALASAMMVLAVAELMITASYVASSKRRARNKTPARRNKKTASQTEGAVEPSEGSAINPLFVLVPSLASGLLLACSRTLWSYATITEVYTLNTLLILVIFFLMFRWRRRIVWDKRRNVANAGSVNRSVSIDGDDSLLYTAALVFALALGVHHVTVALVLPALAVFVYRTVGLRFFTSKRLVYPALLSFAALVAVYAYLPIAARRAPVMNWGSPRTFERVWWHITGRQYQAFLSFSPEVMGEQLVEFGKMTGHEFGVWWLPLALALAIIGFVYAYRRDPTTFWFLVLVIITNTVYALNYDIAEDKDAYYLPTFIALAVATGFGVRWLIEIIVSTPMPAKRAYVLAALIVLIVSMVAAASNLPFNNRSRYFVAHDYVTNILSTIEQDGLLLTLDWQVQSPLFYVREVEQTRRDVKVVDVNLLRRSWYFDYLRRAYPDLIERSRDQVDAFVEELKRWEHDPQAYNNSVALTQRIDSRFQEMIRSFVTRQTGVAPVYVTTDLVFKTGEQDAELAEWLSKNYQLVPHGLVFKLATDRSFHDLPDVRLETRGLTDGTLRFEETDVVNLKVLPVYKTMLVNRGRYLALFNQHERAAEAFRQALALDPKLDMAQQGLDESTNKLREEGAARPR